MARPIGQSASAAGHFPHLHHSLHVQSLSPDPVVLLAMIIRVLTRFDAQAWIAKDLKRGDLHALIDVASGLRPDGLTPDQASRLQARGMARPYGCLLYTSRCV